MSNRCTPIRRITIAVDRKVIPRGLPMCRRVAYPAEHRKAIRILAGTGE